MGSFEILIIDDNLENREILRLFLGKEGYRIEEAEGGRDGIEKCRALLPDLVLLDILMPDLDGFSVFRELLKDPDTKRIPVIFLSAKSDVEDKIRGIEMGAADYVTKPFDKGEVLARVKNQLRILSLQRSLVASNNELAERQRLLEEDLLAASEIQKSLVRSTPNAIGPFTFGWEFAPCSRIGGDIFHAFPLGADHVGFYMADVSGHGVSSALVTVSIYQTLFLNNDAFMEEGEDGRWRPRPPVDVMGFLDREFPMDRFNKYFTAFYGVLRTEDGQLRYSKAGHPPPILLRAGGAVETLDKGGSVIGMGGLIPFVEGELRLEEGDRLFLYTDGITERFGDDGTPFGEARMTDILKAAAEMDIWQCNEMLMMAVHAFGQTPPDDDMALLSVDYRP